MAPDRMISTGVQLPQEDLDKIRILMRGDRRPLGWIVREAVAMYLSSRSADISTYAAKFAQQDAAHPRQSGQHEEDVAQAPGSTTIGSPNDTEKKGFTGDEK